MLLKRSLQTGIAFLAIASQSSWAWSTTTICVQDRGGKPYPKALVTYNYSNVDVSKHSYSNPTDGTGCMEWNNSSGFDSIWNLQITDSLHLDTLTVPGTITDAAVAGNTVPNQATDNHNYTQTYKIDYTWMPSPLATDSGYVTIPGVPYQILYDPPGDGSFASLAQDTALQTSVKTSFGYGAGASLSVGFGYEAPLGIASAEVEVSASVDYKHNTENEFTATVHSGSSLQTSNLADPTVTGPGRGDLFVVPSLRIKWHLYRAYHPKDTLAANDGYVYKLYYQPVRDTSSTLLKVTANYLQNAFASQPAVLAQILGASVIDPATHRIRKNLVDSVTHQPKTSRLTLISSGAELLSGGGSVLSTNFSKEVSQATTVSYDVTIGAEASAKLKVGGVSAGATIKADVSIGKSSGNTSTYNRAFSESLVDANPWDVLRYRMYLDNSYGVYVFDVDSAQSWTSLPSESGYSSPGVDWQIQADHDTLRVAQGENAVFHVGVLNHNRTGNASLDTIQSVAVSVSQNSGASVATDPSELQSPRGVTKNVNVTASSADTGTYAIVVKFAGTLNNGVSQVTPLIQSVPLTLVVTSNTGLRGVSKLPEVRLSRVARAGRVSVPDNAEWTLRTEDVQGRTLQNLSGRGSARVDLVQPKGVAITRLVSPAGSARLVWTGF
jgi:hypothetical protein